jgi:hypothetical protein
MANQKQIEDAIRSINQPSNIDGIDLSSTDYTNNNAINGFLVYVGGAGDIKIDGFESGTETLLSVAVGLLPIRCSKVYKTGTSATSLIAQF